MMKLAGRKTDVLNLNSMNGKMQIKVRLLRAALFCKFPFLTFWLFQSCLFGASSDSFALQELQLSLETVRQQMHGQNVELTLFQERVGQLEDNVKALNQELKVFSAEKGLEKRLINLEKTHEALVQDFKTLKNHLTQTQTNVTQCQTQLAKIDKQLSADIQTLKTSLHSMLTLLQNPGSEQTYTVQPGDSLGQIALEHKTTIKTLKEINNLTADTIYAGQKLLLP